MTWPLFCHNYNTLPYLCDSMVDYLNSWDYLWPMNDKHTAYTGVIDEVGLSTALVAIGSVTNIGESPMVIDACVGITGWRIREASAASFSSGLQLDNDESLPLIADGFSMTVAVEKQDTATIDLASGGILGGSWKYFNIVSRGVSFLVRLDSSTQVQLLIQGDIITAQSVLLNLPFTISLFTRFLVTVTFTRTELKIWINDEYLGNLTYSSLPAPLISYQHTFTNIDAFGNAELVIQNLAMKQALVDTTEVIEINNAYARNIL